jgi:hypothetical protein
VPPALWVDLRVPKARRVSKVCKALRGRQALRDRPDLQVRRVFPGSPAPRVRRVLLVRKVTQERSVRRELRAPLDQQGRSEPQVPPDPLGPKDYRDRPGLPGLPGLRVPPDRKVLPVRLEDPRVHLDSPDSPDLRAPPDSPGLSDLPDLSDLPVHRERRVRKAKLELRVRPERWGRRGRLVRRELSALPAPLDLSVQQDRRASPGRRGLPALREASVRKAKRALPDLVEPLAYRARSAPRASRERLARSD